VSNGFAYGTPTSAVPTGVANVINRLDVATGSTREWFTQATATSFLVGFDTSGNPVIVATFQAGFGVWIVANPASPLGISWNGGAGYYGGQYNPLVADSHGLWLTVNGSVDLYANGQWYLMSMLKVSLGGRCA